MKSVQIIFILVAFVFTFQLNAQTQPKEVYRTLKGEKFHKKDCRIIKDKKAFKVTLKEAKKKGLVACKVCNPLGKDVVVKDKKKSTPKTKTQAKRKVAVRCMGYTLKGKRCKRMTKSADGTCWQH
jgi:hypothetical protein